MTPATRRPIPGTAFVHPAEPRATATHVRWDDVHNDMPDEWPGTDQLLDDFCDLAAAEPDEMAAFVGRYGLPEVNGVSQQARRRGSLPVRQLRLYARGVAAARRVGAALTTRRPGAKEDWLEMQHVFTGLFEQVPADEWDDWKLGRERFATWLTYVFRDCGVTPYVEWRGTRRLSIDQHTDTFLGMVALLLSREVGAEGEYTCDNCGSPVIRERAPRPGHGVYCDRPECKREQRRRNQASWRARHRAAGSDRS